MSYTLVKVGASALVLLGALWGGTTWYSGHQIMQKYPDALAKLSSEQSGMLKMVITRQQPGFLTSRVDWVATVTPDPCKPYDAVQVEGYDEIHNGIFPSLGLGQIQTHIIIPESVRPFVTKVFGAQEPLQITTNISLKGDLTSKIVSPAATYSDEQGKFEWKGLNGEFSQTAGGNHGQSKFIVNGMTFDAEAQSIEMKIGEMDFSGASDKSASGLGVGQGNFVLKDAELNKDSVTYGLKDLKVSADTSEANGFLAVNETFNVGQVLESGQPLGKMDMAFSADHIDALAVKNAVDLIKKEQSVCSTAPDQANTSAAKVLQALQPVLAKGFSVKLDHLNIETKDGKASASGNMTIPSLTEAEVNDPKQALLKVSADGTAKISQSLLSSLADLAGKAQSQIQKQAKAQVQQGQEQAGQPAVPAMPAASAQMVDAMLAKPLEEGFISKVSDGAGTSYVSTFKLLTGKMTVNDKPLN